MMYRFKKIQPCNDIRFSQFVLQQMEITSYKPGVTPLGRLDSVRTYALKNTINLAGSSLYGSSHEVSFLLHPSTREITMFYRGTPDPEDNSWYEISQGLKVWLNDYVIIEDEEGISSISQMEMIVRELTTIRKLMGKQFETLRDLRSKCEETCSTTST
jgi:hypothetical protein